MIRIKLIQSQDRVALFEKAKEGARQNGAKFSGSVASGEFSAPEHGIKGTYKTHGDVLEITISKKPWYMGEEMIKARLEAFFE